MKGFTVALVCLLLIVPGTCGPALADSMLLGSDYLETIPGTFLDFGPGIGPAALMGKPIDPPVLGSTDTIVQRKADAVLPGPLPGGGPTIPIEIVTLSLVSVAPITIGPTFYDVSVHLIQQVTEIKILGGPGQHLAIPAYPPVPGIPGPRTPVLVGLGLPLALATAWRRLVAKA